MTTELAEQLLTPQGHPLHEVMVELLLILCTQPPIDLDENIFSVENIAWALSIRDQLRSDIMRAFAPILEPSSGMEN